MPFQLSTRGRYGVRLMIALAVNYGKGISLLKEVARQEGISDKYLGQIVIPLRTAGLVASQRGARGGYQLAQPPEKITVKDIVEAIEGRICPVPCVEDEKACDRAALCVATRVWKKLRLDIEESLAGFTLAELARQAREEIPRAENYMI